MNDIYFQFACSANGKKVVADGIKELECKPRYLLDEGDPNHPMYDNKLFGYGEQEFLAKQYHQPH